MKTSVFHDVLAPLLIAAFIVACAMLAGCLGNEEPASAFNAAPITDTAKRVGAHIGAAREDIAKVPPDIAGAGKHLDAAAAGTPSPTVEDLAAAREAVATEVKLKAECAGLAAKLAEATKLVQVEEQKRRNAEAAAAAARRTLDDESRRRIEEAQELAEVRAKERAAWKGSVIFAAGLVVSYLLKSSRPAVYGAVGGLAQGAAPWLYLGFLHSRAFEAGTWVAVGLVVVWLGWAILNHRKISLAVGPVKVAG